MNHDMRTMPGQLYSGLIDACEYLKGQGCTGAMYEIGSFSGESAEVFARYFAAVHCVDPWNFADPEIEGSVDDRAAAAGNIFKHKGMSLDIAPSVPDGSLAFAYIDGDHSFEAALADCRAWWPKVQAGGFLGGHDFGWTSVRQALAEFTGRTMADGLVDRVFLDETWLIRKE